MNTKNHVLANMNDGKGNRWIVVKEFKRRIDKKKKKQKSSDKIFKNRTKQKLNVK